ncbi:hypothetical protein H632_c1172p0 [Helicosporidium sp. ATCC 50920]|nr:hypothetical protein H632_c1172p0 [Helicosporidium sp. ATCC 50920]|eukprot:KDD74629.1 hypothetical protein H632_c1172p0 [Helicosporidium sp. ATCC 50920]
MRRFLIPTVLVGLVAYCCVWSVLVPLPHIGEEAEPVRRVLWPLKRIDSYPQRLARALSFKTLASAETPDHILDAAPFHALHAHLEESYPLVWQRLSVEKELLTLVVTWTGTDPSLRPLLLVSHLDVVPAAPTNWTHDPFGGVVTDGYVWGRGALDVKIGAVSILEAMEELLMGGWTPERTIVACLGHDEEVSGAQGAGRVARLVEQRYPSGLELVVDEGGFLMPEGLFGKAKGDAASRGDASAAPTSSPPLAIVGLGEKSASVWRLTFSGTAGHASMPKTDGSMATQALARALVALQTRQPPARMEPVMRDFFATLAPTVASPWKRAALRMVSAAGGVPALNFVIRNLARLGPPQLAAQLRTTVAVVDVQAGTGARNVIPGEATVLLNVRSLPGDTEELVRSHLLSTIGKDAAMAKLEILRDWVPPVTPSDAHGPHFELVRRTILETLSVDDPRPLTVVPYLLMARTDSEHFARLAPGRVFRFLPIPIRFSEHDLERVHGIDERVRVDALDGAVQFYLRLMHQGAGE